MLKHQTIDHFSDYLESRPKRNLAVPLYNPYGSCVSFIPTTVDACELMSTYSNSQALPSQVYGKALSLVDMTAKTVSAAGYPYLGHAPTDDNEGPAGDVEYGGSWAHNLQLIVDANRASTMVSISPSGCYIPQKSIRWNELTKYLTTAFTELEFSAVEDTNAEFQSLFEELQEFSSLPPNWDGEGALAITPPTTAKAMDLLRAMHSLSFEALPSIGPMPDGRYSFTWDSNDKELWIYVSDNDYTSHQWESKTQFESIVRTWRDSNTVTEFIEWLKN